MVKVQMNENGMRFYISQIRKKKMECQGRRPSWKNRRTWDSSLPTSTPELQLFTKQLSTPAITYSVSTEGKNVKKYFCSYPYSFSQSSEEALTFFFLALDIII